MNASLLCCFNPCQRRFTSIYTLLWRLLNDAVDMVNRCVDERSASLESGIAESRVKP